MKRAFRTTALGEMFVVVPVTDWSEGTPTSVGFIVAGISRNGRCNFHTAPFATAAGAETYRRKMVALHRKLARETRRRSEAIQRGKARRKTQSQ